MDVGTGHCKRLAPTWAELGEAVKDNPTIKIAHVDCTVDRDVCTNAEVHVTPAVGTGPFACHLYSHSTGSMSQCGRLLR